jgi:3D (Asp-Asp-Asp) domain-containing protein
MGSVIAELAVSSALVLTGSATAYAPCDGSVSIGSRGNALRLGDVASNDLAYGTWIELKRPRAVTIGSKRYRYFRVRDTGGPGFLIDIYAGRYCGFMQAWGRRQVSIRVVPRSELYRGRPIGGYKFRRGAKGARLVWRAG